MAARDLRDFARRSANHRNSHLVKSRLYSLFEIIFALIPRRDCLNGNRLPVTSGGLPDRGLSASFTTYFSDNGLACCQQNICARAGSPLPPTRGIESQLAVKLVTAARVRKAYSEDRS